MKLALWFGRTLAQRLPPQEHKLRQFPPDVLIQPAIPTDVNVFAGYERAAELIAAGERAAETHLPEIKSLLRPRWRWSVSRGLDRVGKILAKPSFSETNAEKI